MKTIGFDNHMFPGAAVAVGRMAQANDGEVAVRDGGRSLVIARGGAFVDGRPASNGEIVSVLKEIFGETPGLFELRSPDGRLEVDSAGNIAVNGQLAGRDPEMLTRALSFLARTLCPQVAAHSWVREVTEKPGGLDGRDGESVAELGEKKAKFCAYCGREVLGG